TAQQAVDGGHRAFALGPAVVTGSEHYPVQPTPGRGRWWQALASYGYGEHRVSRTIETSSVPRSGSSSAGGRGSCRCACCVSGWTRARICASRLALESDAVPRAGSDSNRAVESGTNEYSSARSIVAPESRCSLASPSGPESEEMFRYRLHSPDGDDL